MTWEPCLAASCAAASCFWIIDSLSPVQLACSSAPRTILGIGSPRVCVVVARGESVQRRRGSGSAPGEVLRRRARARVIPCRSTRPPGLVVGGAPDAGQRREDEQ